MSRLIINSDTSINIKNDPYYEDRVNLAAVFRMTARLGLHEGIANLSLIHI